MGRIREKVDRPNRIPAEKGRVPALEMYLEGRVEKVGGEMVESSAGVVSRERAAKPPLRQMFHQDILHEDRSDCHLWRTGQSVGESLR